MVHGSHQQPNKGIQVHNKHEKVLCRECDWHGLSGELLEAQNPFELSIQILGCPRCKSIDSLLVACDEPNCWKEATCGTPTENGYRRTCGEHAPWQTT